jgi:hypothetical protein
LGNLDHRALYLGKLYNEFKHGQYEAAIGQEAKDAFILDGQDQTKSGDVVGRLRGPLEAKMESISDSASLGDFGVSSILVQSRGEQVVFDDNEGRSA